jgi:RimJ/RimL family protein N-acetyltransferase
VTETTTSAIHDLHWPLATERLTLRPAEASDLDATWRFRANPAVNEWMSSASPDFEVYRAKFEDPDRLGRTLVVELDGRVIGDLMLRLEDAWAQTEVADRGRDAQAELGWCLDPEYTGNGYATEAVAALLDVCFTALHLHRVTANCFADNVASWRLMERLGMRRELHGVRDSLHRSRGWIDGFGYAILADEWLAVRH